MNEQFIVNLVDLDVFVSVKMGKSIIADEGVEKYIGKLLKENKWFVGVIIGQVGFFF